MGKRGEAASSLTRVIYVGTGDYVLGVPADPGLVQEFDEARAAELVATGLYQFVDLPAGRIDDPAVEPEQADGAAGGEDA